jgi:hypothetical protein
MKLRPHRRRPGAGRRLPGPPPQSNEELLKELRALRERVSSSRRSCRRAAPPPPPPGQWGMTPEQARELNRVTSRPRRCRTTSPTRASRA